MIIHLDLDCYFVSAERRRSPELKGQPVVVVKSGDREIFSPEDHKTVMTRRVGAFNGLFQHEKEWKKFDPNRWKTEFIDHRGRIHGIVLARSYECKPFGITTGTHLSDALKMCPHLRVVSGDHLFYQLLSGELRVFLETKIPLLEQYSIDEFWGDLKGWIKDEETENFVRQLQQEIMEKFDLPISIGASSTKWIAKLATDFNKPYGITIVPQEKIIDFVSPLPIGSFPGIGKQTEKKLLNYRIKSLGDVIASKSLMEGFGRYGKDMYAKITGNDNECVTPSHDRRSIGISRKFDLVYDRQEVRRRVVILVRHLSYTIAKLAVLPTTYHFQIRYEGGQSSKSSRTIDRPFSEHLFKEIALEALLELDTFPRYGIHQISLSVTNFITSSKPKTFSLLDHEQDKKQCSLSENMTKLRDKYGVDILRSGVEKRGDAQCADS